LFGAAAVARGMTTHPLESGLGDRGHRADRARRLIARAGRLTGLATMQSPATALFDALACSMKPGAPTPSRRQSACRRTT